MSIRRPVPQSREGYGRQAGFTLATALPHVRILTYTHFPFLTF